jgi:hypothetical protein
MSTSFVVEMRATSVSLIIFDDQGGAIYTKNNPLLKL